MSARGVIYHRKFNGKLARNWTIKLDGLDTKTGQKAVSVKWDKRLTAAQNKTLAEQKMRELLTAHDKGVFIEPTALTVAQVLQDFIDHPGKRRPKTMNVYKRMIDKHLVPAIGHHRVQQLQPGHLEDVYKSLSTTHAPRSIRLINAALSAALTRAVNNAKVFRNVARMVTEGLPTVPRTTVRALSDERTAEVLATADLSAQEKALLEFTFKTGARVSEVCGLWWGDVDLASGIVKIQRQLATAAKVRGKLVPAVFDAQTKTHESPEEPREIPLTAITIKALRAHQLAQKKLRMAHGLGRAQDTDPVFASEPPAKYVGVPLSQEFVRRMFKRVAGVNPHVARHTVATSMEAAGESANTIAAHLGDSVATVQNNYIHKRPEHQKAAVARLDERFYGGAKNR